MEEVNYTREYVFQLLVALKIDYEINPVTFVLRETNEPMAIDEVIDKFNKEWLENH